MTRSKRKWDHIRFALETGQKRETGLDDIRFIHQSLPNSSFSRIDLSTKIGELLLSSPIFINAMTGGGGERTFQINRDLAIAAKETGIMMAVGSQMSALKDKKEEESFKIVRKENPNGLVVANIGSEATVEQAEAVVDMLEANALQIHLNVVQELTMPEGDRNFFGALERIEAIAEALSVPVIIKEVGFGVSRETVEKLTKTNISAVDVGGFGGTNFAKIENKRRGRSIPFFNNWGVPTAVSVVEARLSAPNHISILASGGIQTSMDIAKALALGANAAGLAGFLLNILVENGVDQVIEEISVLQEELKMIMTALGVTNIHELNQVPLIIFGDTYHWLNERGINTKEFSNRTFRID